MSDVDVIAVYDIPELAFDDTSSDGQALDAVDGEIFEEVGGPACGDVGRVPIVATQGCIGCSVATDNSCNMDEMPQHYVKLSSPFCISANEVTNGEYDKCVTSGACKPPPIPSAECPFGDIEVVNLPVVCLARAQAQAYCLWQGGDLPTEAQWELAARGEFSRECSNTMTYTWGNMFPPPPGSGNFASDGISGVPGIDGYSDGYGGTPAPVGSFKGNAGISDLSGNVFEWVMDGYTGDAYDVLPLIDPVSPVGKIGVLRGGSFGSTTNSIRTSDREAALVAGIWPDVGFRCAWKVIAK